MDNDLLGPTNGDLQADGFAVIGGVVDREMLDALNLWCDRRLAAEPADHFERFRFHGSMLQADAVADPVVRQLVTLPRLRRELARRGFFDVRWLSAYLISKPPQSPALWWHQDWWAWEDPVSYAGFPPQLFAMTYLRDVDVEDGALRVIPGSHLEPHPLAYELPEAHSAEIAGAGLDSPAHRHHPDEITVPVKAGDVILGDVRLLHATHPNTSDVRRTCLTLWYLPAWDRLPGTIRAYVVQHPSLPPAGWWREPNHGISSEIASMLPRYDGPCRPVGYRRSPPASPESAEARSFQQPTAAR